MHIQFNTKKFRFWIILRSCIFLGLLTGYLFWTYTGINPEDRMDFLKVIIPSYCLLFLFSLRSGFRRTKLLAEKSWGIDDQFFYSYSSNTTCSQIRLKDIQSVTQCDFFLFPLFRINAKEESIEIMNPENPDGFLAKFKNSGLAIIDERVPFQRHLMLAGIYFIPSFLGICGVLFLNPPLQKSILLIVMNLNLIFYIRSFAGNANFSKTSPGGRRLIFLLFIILIFQIGILIFGKNYH